MPGGAAAAAAGQARAGQGRRRPENRNWSSRKPLKCPYCNKTLKHAHGNLMQRKSIKWLAVGWEKPIDAPKLIKLKIPNVLKS